MTTRIERRTQSRKRPVSLVYVELPPANGGMMRDLSEHGFSLRAMMPLRASEKVGFSFLLDSAMRIDGEAIVVRLEDSGHVAALEFAGLSAHARHQIREWLDKYEESVSKESTKPIVAPAANSSFEELRTEIRSTEARPKAPRVEPPVAKKEPPAPQPVQESSPLEAPPPLKLASVRPANLQDGSPDPTPPAAEVEEIEAALPSAVQPEPAPEPEAEPAPVVAAEPVYAPQPSVFLKPTLTMPPALEPLPSLGEPGDTPSPSWMDNFTLSHAIGIMLFLTLLAGSVVYHREVGHTLVWLGQKIAADETSESLKLPAPRLPVALPPATTEATPNSNVEPAAKAPEAAPPVADSSAPKSAQLPATSPPATPSPQLKDSATSTVVPQNHLTRPPASSAPAETPADGGLQEYQRAQAILHTPGRGGDLAEAVRLLWAAVEKGNVGAEITLAELYRQGRGVNRNCAQAKILLATAARKGSPDAQRRLEALLREGCED